MAERSLANRLWYALLQNILRFLALAFFRIRWQGREHEPRSGGALVVSNHQSHLDPMLIGLTFRRRMNYLARESLFHFPPLRWLIRSLDAIPLDRDGMGIGGLKETLRRLKRGEMVLIFPEGTRTANGEMQPLKPGFCALARRGKVPLLPVGIDGAFQAWPRFRSFPRGSAIHVCLGEPLTQDEMEKLDDDGLIAEVARRIAACHAAARRGAAPHQALPWPQAQVAAGQARPGSAITEV